MKLVLGIAGWGKKSVLASETIAVVKKAVAEGICEFDCAPHYAKGGREVVLGAACLELPGKIRREIRISTKGGRVTDPNTESKESNGFQNTNSFSQVFNYTKEGILSSFYQSQLRLQMSHFFAYYLHDLDPKTHEDAYQKHLDDFFERGGCDAFQKLKREGKITIIGIGSNHAESCIELITRGFKVDRIMLAGCFNLLYFHALDVLFPLCKEKGIEMYIAAPYCGGGLSGELDNDSFLYKEGNAEVLLRRERLKSVCEYYGVKLPHAAMQFVLQHPQVKRVVVGARTVDELQESLEYARTPVSSRLWQALMAEELIPAKAICSMPSVVSRSLMQPLAPTVVGERLRSRL